MKNLCQNYSWNVVLFIHSDFVVITPESSNKFPWISIWRLVKPHADYCVNIRKSCWLRLAFADLYRLLRVNQAKELVTVRVWNAPDKWRNWRGQGCEVPPGKLILYKTGPSPSLYFGIYYSFGFQQVVVFLRFSECFPVISDFSVAIHIRIHYYFSTFLKV